ncbi:MAG: T9SS type A sorting domain-containing protein [Panacibacter sp.]
MNRILSFVALLIFTSYLIPSQLSAQRKLPAKIIHFKDLKCNIEITGAVTDVSCYGDNTGSIDITVKGTKGTVTYLWNDGNTSEDRSGLAAGTYSVTVTDATHRQAAASFTINQPDAPLTVTPVIKQPSSPETCDGSVILDISGGNPLYSIAWNDGYTGSCRKGLCPGSSYRICVTDLNGCSTTTKIKLTASSNSLQSMDASSMNLKDVQVAAVVSPNPTKGIVQLTINARVNGTSVINVYNMSGKMLKTEKSGVAQGINIKTIDLGKYSKGMYYIEMIVDGQKKVVKVMLQ